MESDRRDEDSVKKPAIVAIFTESPDGRYHIGSVLLDHVGDDVDEYFSGLREQYRGNLDDDELDEYQEQDFIDWMIKEGYAKAPPTNVTYAVIRE